jgi:excinuclease ABC subunit A
MLPRPSQQRRHARIKTADWVLGLQPGVIDGTQSQRGDKGGEVVAEGTPEQVAQEPRSYTGGYLKELLAKSVRAEAPPSLAKKKRGSSASIRQREAVE